MPIEYTILHAKRTNHNPFTGFGDAPRAFDAGPLAQGALEITLRRDALDAKQLLALRDERSVVGVAPVMPTRLIAPVGEPAAAAPATASWGVQAVGATTSGRNGAGVCVAVLDTGIDRAHRAFAGVSIIESDFTGSGNGDRAGHGTHCAGTIFGRDVGGVRIGVAPGVSRVLIGKVLSDSGAGTSDGILRGIRWAVENGAHVISMSLGYDFPTMVQMLKEQDLPEPAAISQTLVAYRANLRLFDAMMGLLRAQAAFNEDALVIAAAGNESVRPDYTIAASLPAAAVGMIAVGAAEQAAGGQLHVAAFSNTFPQVCAPGAQILSARAGGGLIEHSGTSMATPHVAGIAALHWQALGRNASAAQVGARLTATARSEPFANSFTSVDYGAGLVTAPP